MAINWTKGLLRTWTVIASIIATVVGLAWSFFDGGINGGVIFGSVITFGVIWCIGMALSHAILWIIRGFQEKS